MSSSNEYAISLKTNRLVKKTTANYKKLKKLGMVREIGPVEPEPETPTPTLEPEPTPEQRLSLTSMSVTCSIA